MIGARRKNDPDYNLVACLTKSFGRVVMDSWINFLSICFNLIKLLLFQKKVVYGNQVSDGFTGQRREIDVKV